MTVSFVRLFRDMYFHRIRQTYFNLGLAGAVSDTKLTLLIQISFKKTEILFLSIVEADVFVD